MDQTSSGITENPGTSDVPVVSELRAMFADLLEGAKKDILSNVQESIDQIYADFEYVESESEGPQNQRPIPITLWPPKSTILFSPNPPILEKILAILLKRLLRSSVLRKKQLLPLTQVWQEL